MMLQIILWGQRYKTNKFATKVYRESEEVFYTQINGQLIQYKVICEESELKQVSLQKGSDILYTTYHIEHYQKLIKLLRNDKKCTLLFIPNIKNIEEVLMLIGKLAIKEPEDETENEFCVALGGKGKTIGEVIMEILKCFYIFRQIDSYELLLKIPSSKMIVGLAEIEDVLKEYMDEQSKLILTPWETEREKTNKIFYLLKGKIKRG